MNNKDVIIGVDCGKKGAFAFRHPDGTVFTENMPETAYDIYDLLLPYKGSVAYMEELHGMPGMSGTAMFTLGRNYGNVEIALLAAGIKVVKVSAQKWEKTYSLGSKSKAGGYSAWKRILKGKAQELFPGLKVTLLNCDALLINEYGYREERK